MLLDPIDLSAIKAIAHDGINLQVLIQSQDKFALQTFPAPQQALEGIKQLAQGINKLQLSTRLEPIKRISVTSSTVKTIGYDAPNRFLEVEFKSGSLYRYQDVPEPVFIAFLATSSKGGFLNAMVKPFFEFEQL